MHGWVCVREGVLGISDVWFVGGQVCVSFCFSISYPYEFPFQGLQHLPVLLISSAASSPGNKIDFNL